MSTSVDSELRAPRPEFATAGLHDAPDTIDPPSIRIDMERPVCTTCTSGDCEEHLALSVRDMRTTDEEEHDRAFVALQNELRHNPDLTAKPHTKPTTEVFVMGFSLSEEELAKITGIEHYFWRTLYKVGCLVEDPNLSIVLVTNKPIPEAVLDYYINLFVSTTGNGHGPTVEDVRSRLSVVCTETASSSGQRDISSTTQQALDNLGTVARIGKLTEGTEQSVLRCFNVSKAEEELAVALGAPLVGGPSEAVKRLGGKSGNKELFRAVEVPTNPGIERIEDVGQIVGQLLRFDQEDGPTTVEHAVLKLDDSFSGVGNVKLSVPAFAARLRERLLDPSKGSTLGREAYLDLLTRFIVDTSEVPDFSLDETPGAPSEYDQRLAYTRAYLDKLLSEGGILEAWAPKQECKEHERMVVKSPSVQMDITPDSVSIVSTHDQILGGKDDQIYLGGQFPADDFYRDTIIADALKIGEGLRAKGIYGRAAADFVVTYKVVDRCYNPRNDYREIPYEDRTEETLIYPTPDPESLLRYSVEINVRKGGTTHPLETARLVTGGTIDPETGLLVDPEGKRLFYRALDNVVDERLKGRNPMELTQFLHNSGLHFDSDTNEGIVPHLITAIPQYGKCGVTCIAHSREDADAMYARFNRLMDEWLAGGPEERDVDPDLDFAGQDLRERRMIMRKDYAGANFRNSDLSGQWFTRADLSGADLRDTNCQKAYFYPANLAGADLRGADLRGADLRGANLEGALIDASTRFGYTSDEDPSKTYVAHTLFTPGALQQLRESNGLLHEPTHGEIRQEHFARHGHRYQKAGI